MPSIPTLKCVTKIEFMPEFNDFIFNIISFKINHLYDIYTEYTKIQKNVDPPFSLCYFKSYENHKGSTCGNLTMLSKEFYNYIYKLIFII